MILNDYLTPGQGSSFTFIAYFPFLLFDASSHFHSSEKNRVEQESQSTLFIQSNLRLYVHLIAHQNFKQSWAFSFNAGLQIKVTTCTQYFDSET